MFLIVLIIGLLLGTINDVATKNIRPGGRIVGGHDADIADYPYQVSISTEGLAFCGGSLISSTWVLTGAHCMFDPTAAEPTVLPAAELTVLANSSHINSGVKRSVARIISHVNFSYATGDSDIALIQLTTPLECVNCKPIALAREEPKRGDTVVLTGWGRVSEYDPSDGSEILQYVEIPFLKRKACQKMYKDTREIITDNMFCAHYPGGGKDSCIGDSGGPAAIDGLLFGLVSWGIGCAEAQYPGVYTNVPKFLEWIREHSGVKP